MTVSTIAGYESFEIGMNRKGFRIESLSMSWCKQNAESPKLFVPSVDNPGGRCPILRQSARPFRSPHLDELGYRGVAAQPGKDGDVLIAVSAPGGSKAAIELSKRARFQLYLAPRVAGMRQVQSFIKGELSAIESCRHAQPGESATGANTES